MDNSCNRNRSSNLSSGPQNYGGCSVPHMRQGYEEATRPHKWEPHYTWQKKKQSTTEQTTAFFFKPLTPHSLPGHTLIRYSNSTLFNLVHLWLSSKKKTKNNKPRCSQSVALTLHAQQDQPSLTLSGENHSPLKRQARLQNCVMFYNSF